MWTKSYLKNYIDQRAKLMAVRIIRNSEYVTEEGLVWMMENIPDILRTGLEETLREIDDYPRAFVEECHCCNEKTGVTVQLDSFGAEKIKVIKVVREITGIGLKEAKDAVEGAPKAIKENISMEEAENIKKRLEDVVRHGVVDVSNECSGKSGRWRKANDQGLDARTFAAVMRKKSQKGKAS